MADLMRRHLPLCQRQLRLDASAGRSRSYQSRVYVPRRTPAHARRLRPQHDTRLVMKKVAFIRLGLLTWSTPPLSMPGTGSSSYSIPGTSCPTLPERHAIGTFTAMTGARSVTPKPSNTRMPNFSIHNRRTSSEKLLSARYYVAEAAEVIGMRELSVVRQKGRGAKQHGAIAVVHQLRDDPVVRRPLSTVRRRRTTRAASSSASRMTQAQFRAPPPPCDPPPSDDSCTTRTGA